MMPFQAMRLRTAAASAGGWVTTSTLVESTNSSGWNGYTLRLVIPASAFAAGSRVRLRLVASTSEGVSIGSAYFGKKAAAGSYNFDGPPLQVLFGGLPGASIPASGAIYTDEIVLPISAVGHVFSVYFNGPSAVRSSQPVAGWFPYYKVGNEAALEVASGYSGAAQEGYSWMVMRVEVWQP